MLEELQRLQAHIHALKARLTKIETENQSLKLMQERLKQQFHAEVQLKDELIAKKLTEMDQLSEQLHTIKEQSKQLHTEARASNDRYNRLERNCNELKNRFQSLIKERDELRENNEKILAEYKIAQQDVLNLQKERDELIAKNEQARIKVESIIQRLSLLGSAEDPFTQDIEQFNQTLENMTKEQLK